MAKEMPMAIDPRVDRIIDQIILAEGGFSDDAADSGGATMFGITEAVAREDGYAGPMMLLPRERARSIYYRKYVVKPGFAAVFELCPDIGVELIDTGVNCGQGVAATFLQQSLNALNDQASLWPDVVVDGAAGAKTLAALRAFLAQRKDAGRVVMLRCLNGLQTARYMDITVRRPKDERFFYGWVLNRVVI